MKKILILLMFVMFGCPFLSSQEIASFQIIKIKERKNNCYELTAKSKDEKYTIYSHFDKSKEHIEKIKRHDILVLKIIPFFKTEVIPISNFKKSMGVKVTAEDSLHTANVTLPLNYKEISVNYYGNILKAKKKMIYYTLDINGLYKNTTQ